MFLVLKFVIVLASIASKVLSSDPHAHTCKRDKSYTVFDYWKKYQYAISGGQIGIKTSAIRFKINFETDVIYAIVPFTTMHLSSHVNRTGMGDIHNWVFRWKHQGLAVVIIHAVEAELDKKNKIGGKVCQLSTFTANEQWEFENVSQSHMILDVPSEWYPVYKEITALVHKLGLSCLKEHVCAAVINLLDNVDPEADPSEENPPTVLRAHINDAVDKSLIRIRQEFQKSNGTIEIPDIRRIFTSDAIEFNATGGTFTNLSTIVRSGEAYAKIKLNEYSITSTYMFRKARIHYDHYNIKYETAEDEGEIFVSIWNLQFQAKRILNAADCHLLSQSVTVTSFRKLNYMLGKFPFLKDEEPNSKKQVLRNVQNLLESPLAKVLENALNYDDTIFGPCMTNAPKEDKIYAKDPLATN